MPSGIFLFDIAFIKKTWYNIFGVRFIPVPPYVMSVITISFAGILFCWIQYLVSLVYITEFGIHAVSSFR